MWAYHCPVRTLPPALFFFSLTLSQSLSRSLPGSCIFNPLSSSVSQGTRHVEQQLRFFFFFWGVRLFYDALAPTCCNRLRGTRRSLGSPKFPTKPHLPHARFSTCDLTFPPQPDSIPHSKSESVSKSKIEFNTQNRQYVINGQLDCWIAQSRRTFHVQLMRNKFSKRINIPINHIQIAIYSFCICLQCQCRIA